MQKKMKKDAVSPVIAVILMVAITVVLAGVLYVWVTSLADTEDTVDNLRLSFDDGADDINSDGSYFADGQVLLKAEQTGGDPIDWVELTIYCEVKDSGNRQELDILQIGGSAFDTSTNGESKTGQIITFDVQGATDFASGDYLVVTITKGDAKVYTSSSIRVV